MGSLCDEKCEAQREAKLGRNKAILFIYAMICLENMSFISNAVSLVIYFTGYMNFGLAKSSTTLTNFMGTAFLLALFGSFISDTCLSKFQTCILFGLIEVLGYLILALQASFTSLRPPPCQGKVCHVASRGQLAMLYAGLYMVALGTGGIKGTLPVLGADQFDRSEPGGLKRLSNFFNWYFFSTTVGAFAGVTMLVWVSADVGWGCSFGVSAAAVFVAVVFLYMGRSLYRNNVHGSSPLTSILQVLVVAGRNWRLPAPSMSDSLHEPGKVAEDKESPSPNVDETIARTNQFHFLDRGAIPTPPDSSAGPWRVCSVTQVEELKILLRMLPIILTTVFMNVCLAQLLTFSIHQGSTMNTRLPATTVHIPVPSLTAIPLAVMFLLIPLYDRAFVPLTRRLTGIPTGIRHLQRVGIGLVLATASMAIAGFVELRRKEVSRRHPGAVPLPMSVFWLGIQFGFLGAADMFTFVGLLEFFYAESAQRMRSLSTSVSWVSLSMGYFGSTAVVDAVNWVTAGWLTSNDLDEDKLEYFYWLLAGVSAVNFGGYLVCASWYRSRKVEGEKEEWSGLARGRWSGEKGNKECQKPIEQ